MSIKDLSKTEKSGSGGSRRLSRKNYRGNRRGAWLLGSAFLIVILLVVLVAADYWANSGKIHNGVSVGSVDLGGKNKDQARGALQKRTTGALKEIQFTGPEKFTLASKQMGVNFDVAGSVDKAYAVGREGNVFTNLKDRLKADLGAVKVSPEVSYRKDTARSMVNQIAQKMDQKPQEASLSVYGSDVQVGASKKGYELNVPATMNNVDNAVDGMTGQVKIIGKVLKPHISTKEAKAAADKTHTALSAPVKFSHKESGQQWTLATQGISQALTFDRKGDKLQVGIDEKILKSEMGAMYGSLEKKPVDAKFVFQGNVPSVQKSQTGARIDDSKLMGELQSGLFTGKHAYDVPVVTAKPQLTTAKAEQVKPTQVLGKYRTKYIGTGDSSQARVDNLKIASGGISGTVLAPGEKFSFDELAAPLQYKKAHIFGEGGKVDSAYGGGLCQVASTLYMAVNWAGLNVTERHPHYAELNYIRPGFDATVWFGFGGGQQLDMKFVNTSPGYIMLREHVENDGYIYAEVYGQKSTGLNVQMDSKPTNMSAQSSTWETYKKVTDGKTGKVLFDGLLHTDSYQPVTLKGKTYTPEDIPVAPIRP